MSQSAVKAMGKRAPHAKASEHRNVCQVLLLDERRQEKYKNTAKKAPLLCLVRKESDAKIPDPNRRYG